MKLILCIFASFLIGSLPFGFIAGKILGVDIRKVGSGNIGATNVLRILGPLAGGVVLLLDIAKGLIVVLVGEKMGLSSTGLVLVSLGVILGHNYSIFLKFKGGKGIATTLGVFLGLDWRIVIVGFIIFLITVSISKFVSLGSILGLLTLPVMVYLFYCNDNEKLLPFFAFSLFITALGILKHKSNIRRLLKGEENKISIRGKPKE